MAKAAEFVGGFVMGAASGTLLLIGGAAALWATKGVWFERPNPDDDLQYFDLMIDLALGAACLAVPAVLGGGLVGAWVTTRDGFSGSSQRPAGLPAAAGESTVP